MQQQNAQGLSAAEIIKVANRYKERRLVKFFPENKVLSAHRHSLGKTGSYFLFMDSHRFLPPLA
jgi:hypothetical protein